MKLIHNVLTVVGDREEMERFQEDVRYEDRELSFSQIVDEQDEEELADMEVTRLEWRRGMWGTEWEPVVSNCEYDDDGNLVYTFTTTTTPPKPFIELISELFDLEFTLKYKDVHDEQNGTVIYVEGNIVFEERNGVVITNYE